MLRAIATPSNSAAQPLSTNTSWHRPQSGQRTLNTTKLTIPDAQRRAGISPELFRGHHRPQARRSTDRAHGASRRTDRSAEPRRVLGASGASCCNGPTRAARASRLFASISTISRKSTTSSATSSATRCCARSRARLQGCGSGRFPGALRRRRIHVCRRPAVRSRKPPSHSPTVCTRRFAEEFELEGHQVRTGLSIGVAIYPAAMAPTRRRC